MRRPDVKPLAAAERRDLAGFLETLTPEQWQGPTLCPEWTVHQMVAHVVSYEELGMPKVIGRIARGRLGGPDANALGVAEYAERSLAELVAFLRDHLTPQGLTAGFGGAIGLTDGLIHHQDIRRPLGAARQIPEERLVPALGMAVWAPILPGRKIVKGLRLVATDVDWSHGDGPEVTGPGESLLLAIAGRDVSLGELSGDGLAAMTERIRSVSR
ncbi:MAG: maleylpyruvate isomerase family mycothiol-dependent enzyme [Actinomycetota bacterium]|nr:maleylpyruvate isomerase family mycothiol-dependent enzyme [Actinomycetota bacterium]